MSVRRFRRLGAMPRMPHAMNVPGAARHSCLLMPRSSAFRTFFPFWVPSGTVASTAAHECRWGGVLIPKSLRPKWARSAAFQLRKEGSWDLFSLAGQVVADRDMITCHSARIPRVHTARQETCRLVSTYLYSPLALCVNSGMMRLREGRGGASPAAHPQVLPCQLPAQTRLARWRAQRHAARLALLASRAKAQPP